jgi:hypothetical protein
VEADKSQAEQSRADKAYVHLARTPERVRVGDMAIFGRAKHSQQCSRAHRNYSQNKFIAMINKEAAAVTDHFCKGRLAIHKR